jgi:hypothetical protein
LRVWSTAPDFDQEGAVLQAEKALAAAPSGTTPLLAAAQGLRTWLDGGGARPPALIRFWPRQKRLRTPVPLAGVAALRPGTRWDYRRVCRVLLFMRRSSLMIRGQ